MGGGLTDIRGGIDYAREEDGDKHGHLGPLNTFFARLWVDWEQDRVVDLGWTVKAMMMWK